MPQDLDRRLRHVLVVMGCTRLPEILELPRLFGTRLDVEFRLDSSQLAKLLKAGVRPCPSTKEYWIVWTHLLRQNAPDVGMNRAIHRPIEGLPCLHTLV